MPPRAATPARILILAALTSAVWEYLTAVYASDTLKAGCSGWCWPLVATYGVPLVGLPVAVALAGRRRGGRTVPAVVTAFVVTASAYATLLGVWIVQEMVYRSAGGQTLFFVALMLVPMVLIVPAGVGIAAVGCIELLRRRCTARGGREQS